MIRNQVSRLKLRAIFNKLLQLLNMKKCYFIAAVLLLCCWSLSIAQTPCSGGFAGSYPCNNVDLMAEVSVTSLGGSPTADGSDIWGWTDPDTGKEYAIVGLTTGTSFVDVSNPSSPIVLGYLPKTSSAPSTYWRDIKVYNNHAFIVADASGHGLQVFDLTTLRSISSPPVTFSPTAYSSAFGKSHNIVGNEDTGFMYAVGANTCSGGLTMFDVSTPTSPTFAGCFSSDGYTHDAICFVYQGPDTDYFGKEICIGSNEDTQTIIDVTDKSNPVEISKKTYSGRAYTHQGWVTDDHKYLIFDDELDESNYGYKTRTHIMDISDLDNQVYLGYFQSSINAIDHNLYIKGQYAYEANYRGGLRILDVQNPSSVGSISEVAYFDTYPSSNSSQFNGAWSSYPFFKSGTVIVSDIERGLFVLRPNLPHAVMETSKIPVTTCEGSDVVFPIDLTAYSGYTDNITLSVSGVPAGATATFGTNPISPNGSTTLTIGNTVNDPGVYSIIISAKGPSNNSVHDVSVAFKLEPLPELPALTLPIDFATNVPVNTSLNWNTAVDADSYTIEVATDAGFTNIVQTQSGIVGTTYSVSPDLSPNTVYHWRVMGENTCGLSPDPTARLAIPSFQFETEDVTPVELLTFKGKYENSTIALKWRTASEVNNKGFEVMRRTESSGFETIGWVDGVGTAQTESNYQFIDRNVRQGLTYFYQLNQVDIDGKQEKSNVISIDTPRGRKVFTLVPNPSKGDTEIFLDLSKDELVNISVYDISGRVIQSFEYSGMTGKNIIPLNSATWSNGVYFIDISDFENSEKMKFVKM